MLKNLALRRRVRRGIDNFNREIKLTRRNKALMKLLDKRGRQTRTVKAAEVKKRLGIK